MSELKVKYAVVTGCCSSHYNRCPPPPAHSQPRWRGWTAGGLLQLDVAKLRSEGKSWLSRTLADLVFTKKTLLLRVAHGWVFWALQQLWQEEVSISSSRSGLEDTEQILFQMEALIYWVVRWLTWPYTLRTCVKGLAGTFLWISAVSPSLATSFLRSLLSSFHLDLRNCHVRLSVHWT